MLSVMSTIRAGMPTHTATHTIWYEYILLTRNVLITPTHFFKICSRLYIDRYEHLSDAYPGHILCVCVCGYA